MLEIVLGNTYGWLTKHNGHRLLKYGQTSSPKVHHRVKDYCNQYNLTRYGSIHTNPTASPTIMENQVRIYLIISGFKQYQGIKGATELYVIPDKVSDSQIIDILTRTEIDLQLRITQKQVASQKERYRKNLHIFDNTGHVLVYEKEQSRLKQVEIDKKRAIKQDFLITIKMSLYFIAGLVALYGTILLKY